MRSADNAGHEEALSLHQIGLPVAVCFLPSNALYVL